MGQYYKFIILGEQKHNNKEIIILVINPHQYGNGAKLMEHSYINNNMMDIKCAALSDSSNAKMFEIFLSR